MGAAATRLKMEGGWVLTVLVIKTIADCTFSISNTLPENLMLMALVCFFFHVLLKLAFKGDPYGSVDQGTYHVNKTSWVRMWPISCNPRNY